MELSKFITRLAEEYPDFHFVYGKRFSFRPPRTIVVGPDEGAQTPLLVFHELGHALSGEYKYDTAVERLKIESLAWQEAKRAYQKCRASADYPDLPPWDDEFVEDALDTYRDWLHTKSKCPICGLTRYEVAKNHWLCPFCQR